jgi:hypothetical protein
MKGVLYQYISFVKSYKICMEANSRNNILASTDQVISFVKIDQSVQTYIAF